MASSSFLGNPYGSYTNPGDLTSKGGIKSALGTMFGQNQSQMAATQGQRNTEAGATLPGYQGLVSSGGYSQPEKSAIEQGTLGGINSGYNSAADAAQRHSAVTHNSAGYGSFMGGLARSKARDLGSAGLQVQSQFANEAYQRKMAGLQGLAQMYGVDTSFLNSLGQNQTGLLAQGSGVQSRSRGILGSIFAPISAVGSLFSGGNNSASAGAKSAFNL